VAQLGVVYAVTGDAKQSQTLAEKLRRDYSPLTGLCILLFCLISAPCVVTVAMTKQETNSWAWALFQFFALSCMAYAVTLVVYQTAGLIMG
jgi:ferrous iron transport protein B